jgi:hypothetical protein
VAAGRAVGPPRGVKDADLGQRGHPGEVARYKAFNAQYEKKTGIKPDYQLVLPCSTAAVPASAESK